MGTCEHSKETLVLITDSKFIDQLSDYWLCSMELVSKLASTSLHFKILNLYHMGKGDLNSHITQLPDEL
jgi:hypothetical protein